MKRARSTFLSLSAVILLGTALLWVGTRGTVYRWGTDSLPGERGVSVWVGGGQLGFNYVDLKRHPFHFPNGMGFQSYTVDESYLEFKDKQPHFTWSTVKPGIVDARYPIWFPGTLVGGVLLGWGLLLRRGEEA